MKQHLRTIACAAGMALATGVASAASYIKVEGLRGDVRFSATVDHWQWVQAMSVDGSFDGLATSFAGGVRVATGDIDGDGRWEQVVMTVDSDIAGQAPHYTWKLDDVIVSSYKTAGSAAGSDYELKDFSSATMSWLPPLADGGRGAPISGHWDRATGRFTGDPAVLAAFEDLGAARWADGTLAITAAVPEPGSWALMALGVAAVGLRLQRQRPTA